MYLCDTMPIKRILTSVLLCFSVIRALSDTLPADTIFFDDGSWYCGEIADSLFDGRGTMFYSDSTIYTGEWKAGLWNGQGTLTYPDGDSYTGHFLDHEFNGYGVYRYHNGARYDGYWNESMFNGAGTFDYADGSTFTGIWVNDVKEGIGIFYDARSNTLYKGLFHNDRFVYETDDDGNPVISGQLEQEYETEDEPQEFLFGVMYSTESNLSFNFDYECSPHFLAGFSIGFSTGRHGKGQLAAVTDEETGERTVLVGWNQLPEEQYMEKDYTMFHMFAEFELHSRHIGIGTALGFGLENTVRNCKSLGGYFEEGELYYKQQMSGVRFGYRIFSDIMLKEMTLSDFSFRIAARLGYGNLDGAFFGLQVCY